MNYIVVHSCVSGVSPWWLRLDVMLINPGQCAASQSGPGLSPVDRLGREQTD